MAGVDSRVIAVLAAACGEKEIVTVEKEVIKEVPVEVERVVEKEVPIGVVKQVEVVVEKEVPVEVEKIVEREVEVEKAERVVVEVQVEKELGASLAAEAAKYGGTLRVVSQGSIETLDMSFSGAWVGTVVTAHLYDRVFERNGNFEPQPQMVRSWTISPDATEFTFTLREGLKFHDGSE